MRLAPKNRIRSCNTRLQVHSRSALPVKSDTPSPDRPDMSVNERAAAPDPPGSSEDPKITLPDVPKTPDDAWERSMLQALEAWGSSRSESWIGFTSPASETTEQRTGRQVRARCECPAAAPRCGRESSRGCGLGCLSDAPIATVGTRANGSSHHHDSQRASRQAAV